MKSKIEIEHIWNTGNVTDYSSTLTDGSYGTKIYEQEKTTTSHKGEVGLAYLSDYHFAYKEDGSKNCSSGYPYCPSWMIPIESDIESLWSNKEYEWTMTHHGYGSWCDSTWAISKNAGYVSSYPISNSYAVRPVFYLTKEITITSGDGSSGNPYILK